ncbi:MAG: DUF1761 domain-containing protein [bacterium]|nr:DUF1761 domain-containing protein [bacterium]
MLIYIFYGSEVVGIVLTAILFMLIGMMWYSPSLFGKKWMKLVGVTAEVVEDSKMRARTSYAFMSLSALVMSYVLALFIKNMFVPNIMLAISVGIAAWVGFIATSMSGEYLFNTKAKPWALYAINSTYYLTNLIIGSAVLFIFLK